jgi:hypothetical protein
VSLLKNAYQAGQAAALAQFKLGSSVVTPVKSLTSPSSGAVNNPAKLQAPTDAVRTVAQSAATTQAQAQDTQGGNQGRITTAAHLCTSCRKEKHYGSCAKPMRTPRGGTPHKKAGFNPGLTGGDPRHGGSDSEEPATSPGYHSATTGDASLSRAREGRPADEQAASSFADLYRHLGITSLADEGPYTTNALNKTAYTPIPGTETHSMYEKRGPSVNPYEERPTRKSPPVAWGDEGPQRIERAFDQVDGAVDSTGMEGGVGTPDPGPAALG